MSAKSDAELARDIAEYLADEAPRAKDSSRSDEGRIAITYFAIPNANTRAGGFMPVYQINDGRVHGHEYGTGYDLEVAEELARQAAEEEAARYIGDWHVTVRPAKSKGARASSSTPVSSTPVVGPGRRRSRSRPSRSRSRRRRQSQQRPPLRSLHRGWKGA